MKTLKTLAIGLAVVGLMSVTSVRASFVSTGGPVNIGSWAQGWTESGVGIFNQVDAYIRSGAGVTWEAPGLRTFSPVTWVSAFTSPTLAIATGPDVNYLAFSTAFTSASSTPLSIDLYAWDGSTLKDSVRAFWSGSGWTYGTADTLAGPSAVPEPTTMIAGALLLLPFGASTLRILRKRQTA